MPLVAAWKSDDDWSRNIIGVSLLSNSSNSNSRALAILPMRKQTTSRGAAVAAKSNDSFRVRQRASTKRAATATVANMTKRLPIRRAIRTRTMRR